MSKRIVNIDVFSKRSIDNAIKYLDFYAMNIRYQMHRMLERLAREGVEVINSALAGANIDGHSPNAKASFELLSIGPNAATAKLKLEGTEVLFVEFGAGVRYSNPQNPKAGEMGMGVGTYPDQTHAFDPKGWHFRDEAGNHIHSYGNPAYMPMYKASEELRNSVAKIFDEYFG